MRSVSVRASKDERQDHRCDLRPDHDSLPIAAICGDASDRRHQEHWDLAGETDGSQQQTRARLAINQPGLCNRLHPRADQGNKLTAEEELEIAVAQGPSGSLPTDITAGRAGSLAFYWSSAGIVRLFHIGPCWMTLSGTWNHYICVSLEHPDHGRGVYWLLEARLTA